MLPILVGCKVTDNFYNKQLFARKKWLFAAISLFFRVKSVSARLSWQLRRGMAATPSGLNGIAIRAEQHHDSG